MKKYQGFTLFETIIYLMLFGLLVSGGVCAAYQVIESTQRTSAKLIAEEEMKFLESKISWGINSAYNLSEFEGGILFARYGTPSSIAFRSAGESFQIRLGESEWLPLIGDRINVSQVIFTKIGGDSTQKTLKISFQLSARAENGSTYKKDFSKIYYLQQ